MVGGLGAVEGLWFRAHSQEPCVERRNVNLRSLHRMLRMGVRVKGKSHCSKRDALVFHGDFYLCFSFRYSFFEVRSSSVLLRWSSGRMSGCETSAVL